MEEKGYGDLEGGQGRRGDQSKYSVQVKKGLERLPPGLEKSIYSSL
jgi:hypothetical protein